MVFRAIKFVADAHEGHYRKGTSIPYISHLTNVMKILSENGCDEEIVTAGILHDVLEDTPSTIEDVKRKFGERVAQIVNASSEPEGLRNMNARESWEERKRHTINYLLKEAVTDKLLVSCADKLDNARAIRQDYERLGDKVWERFNKGKEQQKWYYQSIAKAFLKRSEKEGEPLAGMAKELNETVIDIFG